MSFENPIQYETHYCPYRSRYVTGYWHFDSDRGCNTFLEIDENAPFNGHEF